MSKFTPASESARESAAPACAPAGITHLMLDFSDHSLFVMWTYEVVELRRTERAILLEVDSGKRRVWLPLAMVSIAGAVAEARVKASWWIKREKLNGVMPTETHERAMPSSYVRW